MSAQKENPLLIHSFVLMAVGLAIAVFGVIGIVKSASAAKASGGGAAVQEAPAAPGAQGGAQSAQRKLQQVNQTKWDAKTVGSFAKRPSLTSASSALMAGARLSGKLGPIFAYLVPIAIIAAGIGMGVVGWFVFQRKEWARYLGFGLLAATLLGFVVLMSSWDGGLGDRRASMGLPLVAIFVVTLLCAKFLWDLFVEKFEEQTKPTFVHVGVFMCVPVLVCAVVAPWKDASAAPERPAKGGAKSDADPYSWKRLTPGSTIIVHSTTSGANMPTQKMEIRYTLLSIDEANQVANVKQVTVQGGKVIATEETTLQLSFGPREKDEVLETGSGGKQTVLAGTFDCEYVKIKTADEGAGHAIVEAWIHPDFPLPVKSVTATETWKNEMVLAKAIRK